MTKTPTSSHAHHVLSALEALDWALAFGFFVLAAPPRAPAAARSTAPLCSAPPPSSTAAGGDGDGDGDTRGAAVMATEQLRAVVDAFRCHVNFGGVVVARGVGGAAAANDGGAAAAAPTLADAYRAGAQLRRVGGGRMLQRGSTVTFLSWLRSTPTPYARHAIFYRRVGYWMLPLASVCGGASDAVALGAAGASCFGACAWSGVAVTRRGPRSRHLPPPLIFIYIHI